MEATHSTISIKQRIFRVKTFDNETFLCNLHHINLEDLESIKSVSHMWNFEFERFSKLELKEMLILKSQNNGDNYI